MTLWKHTSAVVILSFGIAGVARDIAAADTGRRTTPAFTYREGTEASIHLVGVGPRAEAIARGDVKRSQGRTRIKLHVEALQHPQSIDALYTAYVLWAVAPEGRAENLAELRHSRAFDVDATTSFPTFGLIVTAEPDASVPRPGPRLIAKNAARTDSRSRMERGTVEYEIAPERVVVAGGSPDFTTPLPLLGARRAVEMAHAAGGAEFAAAELRDAEVKLAALEQLWQGRKDLSKDGETMARDVMRLAEHARSATGDRRQQAAHNQERREAQAAVTRAREDADDARQETMKAHASVQEAQSDAEDARVRENVARAEAERAQLEAQQAQTTAQQAQQDRAEMQQKLYQSLSAILETRREARGFIVSLSDVLFDFNRASLTPGAREKLSKLSGILLAYAGPYAVEIEGHTDAVGSDEYNFGLSRDRAESVRAYVTQAGIPAERVTRVSGFGKTRPVTTNDTAAGRQMNRRVELVIGGLEGS